LVEINHVLASCGFRPEFAPAEIGGRLLGEGGLSTIAPIEPVLDDAGAPTAPSSSSIFSRAMVAGQPVSNRRWRQERILSPRLARWPGGNGASRPTPRQSGNRDPDQAIAGSTVGPRAA
jgi:predicted acylesterase/phospholipase RssA